MKFRSRTEQLCIVCVHDEAIDITRKLNSRRKQNDHEDENKRANNEFISGGTHKKYICMERRSANERKSKSVQIFHCHGWQWSRVCVLRLFIIISFALDVYYVPISFANYSICVCAAVFNLVLLWWFCDYMKYKIEFGASEIGSASRIKWGQNRIFDCEDLPKQHQLFKYNVQNFPNEEILSSWAFVICFRFHISFARRHELMGITQLQPASRNTILFLFNFFVWPKRLERREIFETHRRLFCRFLIICANKNMK